MPVMNARILLPSLLLSFFLFACQSESNSTAKPSEPYVDMGGKAVYEMYCVACHGADGKMKFSGATDLSISQLDLETRKTQIKNGKGVMNAFKGILTDQEIENVAIYIEDLRVEVN